MSEVVKFLCLRVLHRAYSSMLSILLHLQRLCILASRNQAYHALLKALMTEIAISAITINRNRMLRRLSLCAAFLCNTA